MSVGKIFLLTLALYMNFIYGQDEFFSSSSKFGGYGELHYNYTKPEDKKSSEILDFHRFVLFYSHSWTEKWSFKAEVELEHNLVASVDGELELEQAFVNYHYADFLGFKAGVILASVGLLNEYHEPPLFLSVERPDYHNKIIPTTWFGNGISFYGIYSGFNYNLNIMEGLNADNFSVSSGIRNGRQKGFKANAKNLLYNLSLDYTDIPGLKIGTSIIYNDASGETINNFVKIFEGHLSYRKNGLIAVGEWAKINYEKGEVKNSQGYYFDLGYNISLPLKFETNIIPFISYTNYNTASQIYSLNLNIKDFQISKIMFGLNVKPIDEVVFKFDYGIQTSGRNDLKTKIINIGVGYMF